MPILLRHSRDLPDTTAYESWFPVTGANGKGAEDKRSHALGLRLEAAFNSISAGWWDIAATLADGPGAELAYAPTCAGFGSDFGLMMAWGHLTEDVAKEPQMSLIICDDPWLFRHLASLSGVKAGKAPPLWPSTMILRLRGLFSRMRLIARLFWMTLLARRQRRVHAIGDQVILVYANPRSTADGYDDYFGFMMKEMPGLKRAIHTDGGLGGAKALFGDGRTASLHAWGNPWRTPGLLFQRWRPKREHLVGPFGWLVCRAAEKEGGGAAQAMNAWQRQCQKTWLAEIRPAVVAWPWENHGWERAFCRSARRLGVRTVGYQHTLIGRQQLNYSPATNADGTASLPDTVLCDGPAFLDQLIEWGFPKDRLAIGGSFRIAVDCSDLYDPEGPIFVALSAIRTIARQQISAAQKIAASGRHVLIKEHPMYPLKIEATDGISKTDVPLSRQEGISAVLYSTGVSGLEALMAGLPTIRLLVEDQLALSKLPETVKVPAATGDDIAAVVAAAQKPESYDWTQILAPVDMEVWRHALAPDRNFEKK